MDDSNIVESSAPQVDLESSETLDFVRYTLDDLRQLSSIPPSTVFISGTPDKRQQAYEIQLDQSMCLVRRRGMRTELTAGQFFFLDACDEHGEPMTLAVRPEFIWQQSSYWLNIDLVEWSVQGDDEIFNIISHGLSSVCDYFGWTLRALLPEKSRESHRLNDAICLVDQPAQTQVAVQADCATLDHCELRVRQYSIPYRKNCLWLGGKINFKVDVKLDPIQSTFTFQEIINLNIGDLLPLKQNWLQPSVARLTAYATCRSAQGNKWFRKIFLRIDNEDARMEFGNEDWEQDEDKTAHADRMSVTNVDGFRTGENGPDAVELEISVGSTTISFNELCNIQEGSLIEISRSTLPIVKMNVAGETVLEGELVRLGDQLMVQVTKKVG